MPKNKSWTKKLNESKDLSRWIMKKISENIKKSSSKSS